MRAAASTLLPTLCMMYLLCLCASTACAQDLIGDSIARKPAHKIMRMAHQCEKFEDWYSAIELYEIYIRKRPKKLHARYDAGRLYYQVRQYQMAENTLKMLTTADSSSYPEAWFYRGRALKSLGKYDEAYACFHQFKKRYRGLKNKRSYRRLLNAEFDIRNQLDSIEMNLVPAEVKAVVAINGQNSESGLLTLDEKTLLYSTYADDQLSLVNIDDSMGAFPTTKIYTATLETGTWMKGGLLEGEVNELKGNVGNPAITHDGRYMFFTLCDENWQGRTTCEIYQSRRVNDKWKKVEKVGGGINLNGFNSSQPSLGVDRERNRYILYFVSDRPGGKGGLDIWYTQYNKLKDEWSSPRNCGSKINTVGDEETPWVALDEGRMYFSSNGHPGIGGMDIFHSTGEKNRWSTPSLMGIPINSHADDVYFRKQHRDRYMLLSSNRPGSLALWRGSCCDDVYEIWYPQKIEGIVRITAYDVGDGGTGIKDRTLLPETIVKLFYIDPESGEKFFVKSDTAVDGTIDLSIEPGKIYTLEGAQTGFFSDLRTLDTRKMRVNDTVDLDLNLKPWDEKPITIPNIYFEFNSDKLTAASQAALDTTIYKLMTENPMIIVEIMAHTDDKGSDSYNKKLSQERAESVVDYLRSKGIERDRMQARGYGEEMPIAPNSNEDGSDNPEGRAKNRRVELRVIGTSLDIRSTE